MRRCVVECDICGEEVVHDWYEIKANYIALLHGMKATYRKKMVICCKCEAAFIKVIRNWRC